MRKCLPVLWFPVLEMSSSPVEFCITNPLSVCEAARSIVKHPPAQVSVVLVDPAVQEYPTVPSVPAQVTVVAPLMVRSLLLGSVIALDQGSAVVFDDTVIVSPLDALVTQVLTLALSAVEVQLGLEPVQAPKALPAMKSAAATDRRRIV